MKFIPTTATAVEKLKAQAKLISQTAHISHAKALDQAAHDAGYDDWHHVHWCIREGSKTPPKEAVDANITPILPDSRRYFQYLSGMAGTAPIISHSVKGDVFHEVEIEGVRFRGQIGVDGPSVIKKSTRIRNYDEGWVQLGVSAIYRTNDDPRRHGRPADWWVCKYSQQEQRIFIGDLSAAGRYAFAREFGLVIHHPYDLTVEQLAELPKESFYYGNEAFVFYLSPSFGSLCDWARAHPRKIRAYGGNGYLGDWPAAAIAGKAPFE